ncbi:MAG: CPBP family intramembrane metalloprotease [Ruminococcaceae bacterium]|nr:CPBP family intramembrane metalloprotease [Oscillospiraceae bacterium]
MTFEKKKFSVYIVFTFIIGWALQIVASTFALQSKMMLFAAVLSIAMFAPLVSALIAKLDVKNVGWKPQIKKNFKYYIVCWFMPAAVSLIGAALFYIVMPGRLDLSGSYIVAQYGEEMVQQLGNEGLTPVLFAAVTAVQAITYAPVINMIFAAGEEAGWRGVMYPMLKDRLGTNKGRIAGGIIWGAWHWPVMILAGYEYGLVYWGAPFVGMAMFCICCVVMGILLDWTYEKTGSIWAPSLAHGAFNAIATAPLMLLNMEYADQQIIGPAPIGIIAMIPMILLAVLVSIETTKSK